MAQPQLNLEKLRKLSYADLRALAELFAHIENLESEFGQAAVDFYAALENVLTERFEDLHTPTVPEDFYFPAWLGKNGWFPIAGTSARSFTKFEFQLELESDTDCDKFTIWNTVNRKAVIWEAKLPNNTTEAEIFMSKFNL